MKIKSFILLFSFILLVSCSHNKHSLKEFAMDELQAKVAKMNDQSEKYMLDGNYEESLKLYTKDAVSLPSYQPMLKGIDALKKNAEMQKQNPMKMKTFVLTSTDIWQAGKNIIDIGTYEFSMDMPQMPGGEFKDNGKYMTIYEIQKDGSLLIKAETWNTDMNPWMMMGQN